jgi:hypothetical protein
VTTEIKQVVLDAVATGASCLYPQLQNVRLRRAILLHSLVVEGEITPRVSYGSPSNRRTASSSTCSTCGATLDELGRVS